GNGALLGAGEYVHLPVRIDAHRHGGADQAQAGGLHLADQQARAGKPNLRFGGAGDDGAVTVAHDDVAQPQGGAAVVVALELRSTDFDAVAPPETLLDRRGEPWGDEIEREWTAREPPPQEPGRHQH